MSETPNPLDALTPDQVAIKLDMYQKYMDRAFPEQAATRKAYIALKARDEARELYEAERNVSNMRPLERLTVADLLASPSVDWLVEGLLVAGGTTFLVARSGLGKTFLYLDMLLTAAAGDDWYGRSVPKPLKTLFVIGEGRGGFGSRLAAWQAGNAATIEADNVAIIPGINLLSSSDRAQLQGICEDFKPDVVVFDTLDRVTPGVQENSTEVSDAVTYAQDCVNGAALLFVHHPNEETKATRAPKLRGHSALYGLADTVITAFYDGGTTKDGRKMFAVSTHADNGGKVKDGQELLLKGFYVRPESGGAHIAQGTPTASAGLDAEHLSQYEIAFKAVEASPGCSKASVKAALEAAGHTVSNNQATAVLDWLSSHTLVEITEKVSDAGRVYGSELRVIRPWPTDTSPDALQALKDAELFAEED